MPDKVVAQQIAEWDKLTHAVLYTPSYEVAYAQISPIENLYDDVINLGKAREEHLLLKDTLKKEGVKVYELSDLVKQNPLFKSYLVDKIKGLHKKSKYILHERWAAALPSILEGCDPETLWLMAILRPEFLRVSGEKDVRTRSSTLDVRPLGNLFYMRDQQFVTDKGLVMGNLKMPARAGETEITKLGFASLGINPAYSMKNSMEGGDFLPAGKFAFVGSGYRNTQDSINELLKSGALGYEQVVIVNQPPNQETMHLDTYFNILGHDLVAGDSKILKTSDCTVFTKSDSGYTKKATYKFFEFLEASGFKVLEVDLSKERFSTNFIALKDRKILMPANDYLEGPAKRYEKAGVEVILIHANDLLAGYGGVHCMTAALRRER